ncbi:MAG: hypothetical protein ACR2LL_06660 [Nitrosopumilus sp.]|uniref:hypothetical protein n=1 Tax=Nitrosopumilus sp. TaxID=2024843 RepID=UPI002930C855|nr:hypothetical protein [Nitrosopumilus sp.]
MGLSTVINTRNVDSTGRSLSPFMKKSFERLRTYDVQSKTNANAHAETCKTQEQYEILKLPAIHEEKIS